jgi:transcriptional regulator with XRE-family HTH domain
MDGTMGAVLQAARLQLDMSQEALAMQVGVSKAAIGQWERGTTFPSTANLVKVCKALGIDVSAAAAGTLVKVVTAEEAGRRDTPEAVMNMRHDLPVYAAEIGNSDDLFTMPGEVVDYVRRPRGTARNKTMYAIYVPFSSLAPKFETGELIYIDPSRPPSPRDYVLVNLGMQNGLLTWTAGRILSRLSTGIEIEQFNPQIEKKISAKDVEAIHRVVPWKELIDG